MGFRVEERPDQFLEVGWLEGFKVGLSGYFDRVDMEAPDPSFREEIFGAHAVYEKYSWEVAGEIFKLKHDKLDLVDTKKGEGGYLFVGYGITDYLKPYVRVDVINLPAYDPYYTPLRDTKQYTGGVRLDPFDRVAIKVEYSRSRLDDDNDRATDDRYDTLSIGASFTF